MPDALGCEVSAFRPDAQGFVEGLLEASGLASVDHDTGIVQPAETAQRESQEPDRGPERTTARHGTLHAPDVAAGPTAPVAPPAGATLPPRKIREGTAEDLERLKALFEAKKHGTRRNLSWSRACDEAGTTVKTAGVYLPDIKAQWIAMDKAQRQQKSTQPRKRPGRK